jgi:hypothetical protein
MKNEKSPNGLSSSRPRLAAMTAAAARHIFSTYLYYMQKGGYRPFSLAHAEQS